MRSILSLLVLIGLTANLAHCAKAKAHGYLYTPDANSASKIINQGEAAQTFNDKDLQNLISHNLGLIENPMDLTDSSKTAISKFGSKNFMSQQKLNYLFLLEGEMLQAISEDITKKVVSHKSSEFELCGGENLESCILDLLFNHNNSGALVNTLEQVAKDEKVEAYYYSSDAKTSKAYSNSLLSLDRDSKGNLFIVENSIDKPYRIGMKLDQCLSNIMEGGYIVDMAGRTITLKDQSVITVSAEHETEFVQYMEDMCSIYAISKLIRKEAQPSLFTFYINSISKLGAVLGKDQSQVLYDIFNLAYKQFIQNVKKHYGADEISGQVMVLSHNLEKMYENRQPAEKRALSLAQVRILENKGTTAVGDVATDDTATQVIYKSVLVAFVLINLWIWAEMFQMGYSKDTIVYAKFLAADYFRR